MEKYTIDLKKLVDMREPLTELKNMIGMESVKKSIIHGQKKHGTTRT